LYSFYSVIAVAIALSLTVMPLVWYSLINGEQRRPLSALGSACNQQFQRIGLRFTAGEVCPRQLYTLI